MPEIKNPLTGCGYQIFYELVIAQLRLFVIEVWLFDRVYVALDLLIQYNTFFADFQDFDVRISLIYAVSGIAKRYSI